MVAVKFIVVAEKPSVARRIRAALKDEGILVTSVRGHILDSDFPSGYGWRECSPSSLFDVKEFKDDVRDYDAIRELKKAFREGGILVIATDNDSEGELIGAEMLKIWRQVREDAPYKRMRFNSTDFRELRRAWQSLENDLKWNWVMKALFRQRFDLVTGAAFTRLLTLSARRVNRGIKLISWGTCQAPTLWFVVQRERERLKFKSKPFWTIRATFKTPSGEEFEAESARFWDKYEAQKALEKASAADHGVVTRFDERIVEVSRPTPIRTDDLLRDLVKLTGLSAAKILEIAEDLYANGYISYPRTDTNRYKPDFDFKTPLRAACRGLGIGPPDVTPSPLQGRLDDGAHTPIYPVMPYSGTGAATKIWEYIARRFLANAFYLDAVRREKSAEIDLAGIRLKSSGAETLVNGFYEIYSYFKPEDNPIPELTKGESLMVVAVNLHEGKTKPPNRLTESELLKLMEENGIGTDATRASFPKLIVDRGYVVKEKRVFKPTPLGMKLIELLESVDSRLMTPETRRRVEELMGKIEIGELTYEEALRRAIEEYKPLYLELEKHISSKVSELALT